jgi:hypothetical protein
VPGQGSPAKAWSSAAPYRKQGRQTTSDPSQQQEVWVTCPAGPSWQPDEVRGSSSQGNVASSNVQDISFTVCTTLHKERPHVAAGRNIVRCMWLTPWKTSCPALPGFKLNLTLPLIKSNARQDRCSNGNQQTQSSRQSHKPLGSPHTLQMTTQHCGVQASLQTTMPACLHKQTQAEARAYHMLHPRAISCLLLLLLRIQRRSFLVASRSPRNVSTCRTIRYPKRIPKLAPKLREKPSGATRASCSNWHLQGLENNGMEESGA